MNNYCVSKSKKSYYSVNQSGLSLVELMISITVSLVIMGGVLQLYASATRNASSAQGASRLQENIRYAVTRLSNDIARAGNMGCFSFSAVGPPTLAGDDEQNGVKPIKKSIYNYLTNRYVIIIDPDSSQPAGTLKVVDQGGVEVPAGDNDIVWYDFENSFISGGDDDATDANVLDGTDTLIVKFVDSSSTIAITDIPDESSFTLDNVTGLSDGDVAFAGNCNKLYVFNLSNVDGDTDNNVSIANDFTHDLNADVLSKFYTGESGAYRYYIGGAGCTAAGVGRANCSLFRSLNSDGVGQELVTGVHDFQVTYGYEEVNANTVQLGGRLTIDRVQIDMEFNTMDSGTLLTKTITHVFAVRNQL